MRRPSATTAAAVSSHELSIPSTTIRAASKFSTRPRKYERRWHNRPPPFALRPLAGRRRQRRRRLRLAGVRALLLDEPHGLDHVHGALQLHVLLQILQGILGRQRPILRRGVLGRLDDDVGCDALAVDRAAL